MVGFNLSISNHTFDNSKISHINTLNLQDDMIFETYYENLFDNKAYLSKPKSNTTRI